MASQCTQTLPTCENCAEIQAKWSNSILILPFCSHYWCLSTLLVFIPSLVILALYCYRGARISISVNLSDQYPMLYQNILFTFRIVFPRHHNNVNQPFNKSYLNKICFSSARMDEDPVLDRIGNWGKWQVSPS